MTENDYKTLSKMSISCHWYCKRCEKEALTAIKTDLETEERCKVNMSRLNEKIEDIQSELSQKADKKVVEDIDANVKLNSDKITGIAMDCSKLNKKIDLAINEGEEIDRRKCNIITKGLQENEVTDADKVIEVLLFLKSILTI